MKKYNVSYSETVHYLTQKVEAKNIEEAREKFVEMLNEGRVMLSESNASHFEINEIQDE